MKSSKGFVTIDSYNSLVYKVDKSKFYLSTKIKRSKNDILISYVDNKDLIIDPVELSSNLPDEHLDEIIADKVYEDLRLDPSVEYSISAIKTSLNKDKTKYQAIINDTNALKDRVEPILKKVKYIDYIVPAPLLYKSLYQEKLLDSSLTDMFIFFDNHDTTITFYHKGEYIYSKSIKYSLENIYNRFVEIMQDTKVSRDKFVTILKDSGLKHSNELYRETIIKIMNECFLSINEVDIYVKRAYDIKKVDKIYIDFSWGYLDGVESYVKSYLNSNSNTLSSIYEAMEPSSNISPFHYLMYLSANQLERATLDIPNLTPYPKPKPFTQRIASKLILGFILTIALFMIPIVYSYFIGITLKGQNIILQQKEYKLTRSANIYKKNIKKRREDLKILEKEAEKTSKLFRYKKSELAKVYSKKFNYKLRSEKLAEITNIFKKYDIKSKEIRVINNLYTIEIDAEKEKSITAFVNELTNYFRENIDKINIKEIIYRKKDKMYEGTLDIIFKENV